MKTLAKYLAYRTIIKFGPAYAKAMHNVLRHDKLSHPGKPFEFCLHSWPVIGRTHSFAFWLKERPAESFVLVPRRDLNPDLFIAAAECDTWQQLMDVFYPKTAT